MHKKISRKTFLKNLSYASVGILNFSSFLKSAESGDIISKKIPLKNDPDGIISLINGFEYRILSKKNNNIKNEILMIIFLTFSIIIKVLNVHVFCNHFC